MFQRVLLATFSNTLSSCLSAAFCPPFSHFDPFGTEFCEPGWVSHQMNIFDFRFLIFDLPLPLSTTRANK
jgi:hypothetical protein